MNNDESNTADGLTNRGAQNLSKKTVTLEPPPIESMQQVGGSDPSASADYLSSTVIQLQVRRRVFEQSRKPSGFIDVPLPAKENKFIQCLRKLLHRLHRAAERTRTSASQPVAAPGKCVD